MIASISTELSLHLKEPTGLLAPRTRSDDYLGCRTLQAYWPYMYPNAYADRRIDTVYGIHVHALRVGTDVVITHSANDDYNLSRTMYQRVILGFDGSVKGGQPSRMSSTISIVETNCLSVCLA